MSNLSLDAIQEATAWFKGVRFFEPDAKTTAAAYTVLAALHECAERRENKPLTMEQLKERGGRSYWHKSLTGGDDHWSVLPDYVSMCPQDYHYGERWIAYDHEPERSEA